jgi:hypothetical protein
MVRNKRISNSLSFFMKKIPFTLFLKKIKLIIIEILIRNNTKMKNKRKLNQTLKLFREINKTLRPNLQPKKFCLNTKITTIIIIIIEMKMLQVNL